MDPQAPADGKSTLDQIVEIILDGLEWPSEDGPPGPATQIGEEGLGLDSLMVVELALDLEEKFDLEIDEEEMFTIGGMTLEGLAEFVDSRVRESAT